MSGDLGWVPHPRVDRRRVSPGDGVHDVQHVTGSFSQTITWHRAADSTAGTVSPPMADRAGRSPVPNDEQLRTVRHAAQLRTGIATADPKAGGDVLEARKEPCGLGAKPPFRRHP